MRFGSSETMEGAYKNASKERQITNEKYKLRIGKI